MQSSARWIAILILPGLLFTLAFAGNDAKKAPAQQSTSASDSTAAAPQATPMPAPKHESMSSSMRGQDTPGGEAFLGYSYLRFNTTTGTPAGNVDENFDYIPGGVGALQGNINNWLGLKGEIGGYDLFDVGGVDSQIYTYLFGPVFSFRHGRFMPFVHALVGGARITADEPPGFIGDTAFFGRGGKFHQNSFAADGGVGLDWNVSRHVAIRLFQGDYLYTRFTDFDNDRQDNIRASGGLVFHFGYPAAPPPVHRPPTATCSANPTSIEAGSGATAEVHADAVSPDNLPLNYAWSATGGSVEGTGPEVHWNPGTSAPGTYTVTAHVDDGQGGTVSCSADVVLAPPPNRPPTMSCSAASATVPVGQRVAITATASDPQNYPLTYTWTTTGGQVVGTGPEVQLDTTGVAPGHYTVSGEVNNGHEGTADCKAELDVLIPPEQKELEARLALHSIYFPTAQPTVRNPNGGLLPSQQRTLLTEANDFKKYLTYRPDAVMKLTGYADPRGSAAFNKALSERRVERVKNFLVEQGIPADHIQTEGLGEEQPLSPAEVKTLAEQDTTLTPAQRARIEKNARTVALAQNRRVDLTLSTTGQTSERKYPFNAEDVLTLINPRSTAGAAKRKVAPKRKHPAPAHKP